MYTCLKNSKMKNKKKIKKKNEKKKQKTTKDDLTALNKRIIDKETDINEELFKNILIIKNAVICLTICTKQII